MTAKGFSPKELTALRAARSLLQLSAGTIVRTGQTVNWNVSPRSTRARVSLDPQLFLQAWSLETRDSVDLKPGDQVAIPSLGYTYYMETVTSPSTISVATAGQAVAVGPAPLPLARTQRQPTVITDLHSTGGFADYLTGLPIWQIDGMEVYPVTPQFMADTFNVETQQPGKLFLSWPAGSQEDHPIKPNDWIITDLGAKYQVHGVLCYQPLYIVAFVNLPFA